MRLHRHLIATLLATPALAYAAEPGSAVSLLQVLPGLGAVLLLIAACAWVAKRAGLGGGGRVGGNPAIRFVSSQSLGAREKVVILEVNGQWLVLGVAPGRVSTLPKPDAAAPSATPDAPVKPAFAVWLEKALSKK
jgi:flagellar protein FliO/FliZ